MASLFSDPGTWFRETTGAGRLMDEVTGASAARDAADIQAGAADRASQLAREIYMQQREDLAPFRQTGLRALAGLEDPTLGISGEDIRNNPAYQFRLGEGMKATNMGFGAGGNYASGARQKELLRYGQGLASQEYDNAYNREFNRLSQMAGIGSGSNAQLVNSAGNYGQQVGSNLIGSANAQAASVLAPASNLSNLLGQGIMGYGMYAASDVRLKKNISEVDPKDIAELRKAITPYIYKYKDRMFGDGEHISPMAQDLEKTKLGKLAVSLTEDGFKMVNYRKLIPLVVAAWGVE